MNKSVTYEEAGVSIEANDEMVEKIAGHVSSTFGPRVMHIKGGFAGMFRLDYDENLMTQIAISGGGNYYFIENIETAKSIFAEEYMLWTQNLNLRNNSTQFQN